MTSHADLRCGEHLKRGFTLIELSIVLVIIGLIAGGVMVGRDLIETATIRGQVTQIEKYTAAANTFRTKYNFLPGDLPAAQVDQLGPEFFDRTGAWGDGDGDGYIQTKKFIGDPRLPPGLAGETAFFWTDLAAAGLIEGGFVDSQDVGVNAVGDAQISKYLPRARISNDYVTVYGQDDGGNMGIAPAQQANNYEIVSFSNTHFGGATISGGHEWICPSLTPLQAQAIDQKMDDGLPLSGRVQAMIATKWCGDTLDESLRISVEHWGPIFWTTVGGSDCIQNTTPVTYKTADAKWKDVQTCSLRVRAGF